MKPLNPPPALPTAVANVPSPLLMVPMVLVSLPIMRIVTMATLNRKFLKALGVDEDKIDAIIEAHTDVTSVLVKERDEALSKAGDIEKLTRERDELKQKVT